MLLEVALQINMFNFIKLHVSESYLPIESVLGFCGEMKNTNIIWISIFWNMFWEKLLLWSLVSGKKKKEGKIS